jgi:hypothetical protein
MLHLKRPPKPPTFDQEIQAQRAQAEQEVQRYRDELARRVPNPKKPEFPAGWSRYKASFAEAQHGKCGYCEHDVIGGFPGDVEHFRPKGEVWALSDNPDEWGQERPWSASVEGRKHITLSGLGYWWLAYDWNNWLLSCSACNAAWKGSFFPVASDARALPPDPQANEEPLLLNPFEGPDPAEHLRFGLLGEVQPLNDSRLGLETIKVCGLDRTALRDRRQRVALSALFLARQVHAALASQPPDEARLHEALVDFRRIGDESAEYAGVVRAILLAECSIRWEELEGIS